MPPEPSLPVLAYVVRQCLDPKCRRYVRFPVLDWIQCHQLDYLHHGVGTEFVRIESIQEANAPENGIDLE